MDSTSSVDLMGLIARARSGEMVALGRLLEMYRSYIGLLATLEVDRRFQGKMSPSDVVQETFLRARTYFVQFRGSTETELVAWLRRTLATTLAQLVRHYSAQRRDVNLERQLDIELDKSSRAMDAVLAAEISSPSERAIKREQAVILADALVQLAPDHREVIVLRHLEGMAFADVAQHMGRSVDSVKNLWLRALAKVRESVGEM